MLATLQSIGKNLAVADRLSDREAGALAAAVARRTPLRADREAVRLSHEAPIAGLTVDDYAGWLLLTDYRGLGAPLLRDVAERALAALEGEGLAARGAVAKVRPDNLSHRGGRVADPIHLAGDAPPETWTVEERGARFAVRFRDAGFATGLFLDMAEGRRAVRALAGLAGGGGAVLNLFSYTGPFSIAAALGGAAEVIEVDASRKWLAWSRQNQRLNGLPDGLVRQRCDDAVKHLARQGEERFDLVVCDPPSYANPKRGKRFTIDAGYREMARHLTRVLRPGGYVLACCNHARTPRGRFRQWVEPGLRFERWIEPPPDFDDADYLKVALFRRPPT